MKFRKLLFATAVACCMTSCKSYMTVPYFQDLKDPATTVALKVQQCKLTIAPADKLNIVVSSGLTPDVAIAYNLPLQASRVGAVASGSNYGSNSQSTMPYLVDSNGDIDFPILGKIRVAGMTREEVGITIKDILIKQKLLNDAIVTVEVLNHYVNVLGDVRSPGRIQIEKDNLNILEAIAKCGDLNITGERNDVMILRKVGNEQKVLHVDLTNAADLYASEAYYLQPEDVIYVNPNLTKQRTSMAVGNSWQTPSVYFSLTSIALSVTTLLVSLLKK